MNGKVRDVHMFNLWYFGSSSNKHGEGISVDGRLGELVIEVKRINDKMMMIKLVIEEFILNMIINIYHRLK